MNYTIWRKVSVSTMCEVPRLFFLVKIRLFDWDLIVDTFERDGNYFQLGVKVLGADDVDLVLLFA